MELIKSFEEACKVKGLDPEKVVPDVSMYPEEHREAVVAVAKLFIIADVLNEGHVFNWNDWGEEKHYPWFDMEKEPNNPSGFRFDVSRCAYHCTRVGSRLVFRTRKLSDYAGKQFEDLYRALMVR